MTDAVIPVIDFGPCFAGGPGARESCAAELRHALERVGFFIMVNHGVPGDLTCQGLDAPPRFPPITYEAYLNWWYKANYDASLQSDDARKEVSAAGSHGDTTIPMRITTPT
jgi:hypothetical protein